jgi:hypothetical protein
LENLLRETAPGTSQTFCRGQPENEGGLLTMMRNWASRGDASQVEHGEALCNEIDHETMTNASQPLSAEAGGDWPRKRRVNFAIQDLQAVAMDGGEPDDPCVGLTPVAHGASVDCYYAALREGPIYPRVV